MSAEQSFGKSKLRSIIGMVLLLIMVIASLKLINVTSIECYEDDKKIEGDVCDRFLSLYGNSLFFTDFSSVDSVINMDISQSEDSYYLDRIAKKLPGKLIIYLINEPIIYRHMMDGEESYLVNRRGSVRADNSILNFPEVKGFYLLDDLSTSQLDQDKHLYLASLIESLQNDSIAFTSIEYRDDEKIIIYLPNSLLAITSFESSPKEESKRLSMILEELNRLKEIRESEGNDESFKNSNELVVKEIDLRFNYPILRK